MASVNKAIILGNLGRDPEFKEFGDGGVANLAVATTRRVKGRDGNYSNETEWHNVSIFGKSAEVVRDHFHKGDSIYVEGRIRTRDYTGKDGVKRWKTEIIAESWQFGSAKRDQSAKPAAEDDDIQF